MAAGCYRPPSTVGAPNRYFCLADRTGLTRLFHRANVTGDSKRENNCWLVLICSPSFVVIYSVNAGSARLGSARHTLVLIKAPSSHK